MSNAVLLDEALTPLGATLVLGHGAGAPMDSPFMALLAAQLALRGVRVLRFEFPYMAARRRDGGKRPPNPMPVLQAHLRELCGELDQPFFVGGKSMGGRVASMLAGELGARGFLCFGYPFHPPGKPEKTRIAHLQQLECPGLILQGTRDPFGKPEEVAAYTLDTRLQLHWLDSGEHDFKPLKASGRTQQELIAEAAEVAAGFCRQHL
ncbi:alpha/beta family hydrolase [Halopseudomonas sabulinigri]|uniref:KANL3/Tex30 alpha/beta hydrolase-like domain-containing protein n=1 Tax=Halopseudomonas sabulinigri TaxID=472181 RepID=A0ABP9ZPX0_9GAMM